MDSKPEPPKTHQKFIQRYPKLGEAWEEISAAGKEGPLDEKTIRLIKLGIAMAALHEGAVHANVRKALAMGITTEEIEQVIALTAGTIGMPWTVAVYTWVEDITKQKNT